ncbi:hypothetical protein ACQ7JO_004706 [Vibrio parahaemolyticus]|uniref:hypothetical protein n=1 Tax=Vibrio parahaemolyticus TaxID=670 RepID=UPI00041006A6|nr:hypothetical protein [Vibrio parahaemolyticus]MCX8860168.1 hypothetical protein [Vibrio parahaemolyticus]MCX8865319.1 hypothetical protein [Vibrio parahaemolyticus]MCX8870404.1 hypothetical protein [Vibrio parahaemolyticus]MCX8900618.1 hypothetical protein [Vibrio parahaemolyticus]MCX8920939.1 hypothetical protein [Vibrio parahaemolyticus]
MFSVELSEHKSFKDLVYPLVRSKGFLIVNKEQMGIGSEKNHLLIARESLNKFHNAVLLQGFFADSKRVKAIFTDSGKRMEAAEFLNVILAGRQSIIGVGIQSEALEQFINIMKSSVSLSENRLPNPFYELPQLSIGNITSVMQALLAQSAVLSDGETMMLYYLNGDLEKAYEAASSLQTEHPVLSKYQSLISQQYLEANEFDNLLDDLIN